VTGRPPLWRVGRHASCHIYEQAGDWPHANDRLIGRLDLPEDAALAVMAHNAVIILLDSIVTDAGNRDDYRARD
jgi:hypothetical protein